MTNYININGFNPQDSDNLSYLRKEFLSNKTFETLTDMSLVASALQTIDSLEAKDLFNIILTGKHNPNDVILRNDLKCPICGNSMVEFNGDYQFDSTVCLVCECSDNQFMYWFDMRATNNDVIIWDCYFNNTSVENTIALDNLLQDLKRGSKPDTLAYTHAKNPKFVDDYMNDTVVNHKLSEYMKIENTCYMIIENCKTESTRETAHNILKLLQSLDKDRYINSTPITKEELYINNLKKLEVF